MDKSILLSFDIEEFDLPQEYCLAISKEDQFKFSLGGFRKIIEILDNLDVAATFFVTASFASKYPAVIRSISKKHEVASHNLMHSIREYSEEEVMKSKRIIEEISGKKIYGFRMPRVKKVDYSSLGKLGFRYDSSVSPTYLPGRYNNYFEKRKAAKKERIYEIPISTPPLIRLPYWNFFRLFGIRYLKLLTKICLKNPGFVNIYFHPWEFNRLTCFKIPFYLRKSYSGARIERDLENYILWCKKNNFKFLTFSEFLKTVL